MTRYGSPYACPECAGEGEYVCPHCEQDTDCSSCNGSGLNDTVVDVPAFLSAANDLRLQQEPAGQYSIDWIENGVQMGVRFSDGRMLAVMDFLLEKR
jgi:DnaJ-class molecular chaperone